MTNLGQRIFAFTMAAVFLFSAVAFSVFVIYDMQQSRKTNQQQQQATAEQSANSSAGKPLENFTPVESVATLEKTDTKVGDGQEAMPGDTVTVDYTGAIATTGKIFQSSKDAGQPAAISLDQVITGWKEGIPGMKVGGTRRLLIPAVDGYADKPPQGSGIPSNADLVFDVTLISIGDSTATGSTSTGQ